MADTIIVGVTCDVKQDELVAHCRARATYHAQKAVQWKSKLTALLDQSKEAMLAADTEQVVARKLSGYSTANPLEVEIADAKTRARDHEDKAAKFTFWSEHLPEGAVFRLRMSELAELELTSR